MAVSFSHRLPRLARYLQAVLIVQRFSCQLNKLELNKLNNKLNSIGPINTKLEDSVKLYVLFQNI